MCQAAVQHKIHNGKVYTGVARGQRDPQLLALHRHCLVNGVCKSARFAQGIPCLCVIANGSGKVQRIARPRSFVQLQFGANVRQAARLAHTVLHGQVVKAGGVYDGVLCGVVNNLVPIFIVFGQAAHFRHPVFGQAGALFVQISPLIVCLIQRYQRVAALAVAHLINIKIDIRPFACLVYGIVAPHLVPGGRFGSFKAVCHLLRLLICIVVAAHFVLRLAIGGAVIGQKVLQPGGKL